MLPWPAQSQAWWSAYSEDDVRQEHQTLPGQHVGTLPRRLRSAGLTWVPGALGVIAPAYFFRAIQESGYMTVEVLGIAGGLPIS